jgi:hypothetical protein
MIAAFKLDYYYLTFMLRAGMRAIGSLALLHTAASSASIIHSATGRMECWNDGMVPPPAASWQPSSKDLQLSSAASSMYSGAGLDCALCSDAVTFEDAAAMCCGRAEVAEAFRALRSLKPEPLSAPQVCYSTASSVVILLHQRYFGCLVVRSELHLALDGAGLIQSMEERWNGKRLLGSGFAVDPMRPVRRLNALFSFLVTTKLLA